MTLSTPRSRRAERHHRGGRAFTLVELIVVMVLMLIIASMVAPRMASFFRGRVLNAEARRVLSLTRYAQGRAIAEGMPVLLWIDPARSMYGVQTQGGHAADGDRDVVYTAEPSLTLEATAMSNPPVSELGDETLGLGEGLPAIRFTPDGFFDDVSVSRIVIRQGDEGALEVAPMANRLRFEIRPPSHAN